MRSSRNMLRRYREMNSYEKEEFPPQVQALAVAAALGVRGQWLVVSG